MSGSIDFGEFLKVRPQRKTNNDYINVHQRCISIFIFTNILFLHFFSFCFYPRQTLLRIQQSIQYNINVASAYPKKIQQLKLIHNCNEIQQTTQVIETQKERAAQFDDESDLIDAYVACGGNADKSGCVSADMLIKIIKHDFGLTIDIEELIRAIDTDGSGEIEFEEFKTLLS